MTEPEQEWIAAGLYDPQASRADERLELLHWLHGHGVTLEQMIAGCAAALTSQTGKIGYLGPLINDETRRLAASAYLGAKYAWSTMLGKDPQQLQYKVNWIGFWFNIPGVTADPTQVADDFFNQGYDVVISGIDTTEALVEADKMAGQGKAVWAIPYDYIGAIDEAPKVALGVPYFNWGPAYVEQVQAVLDGKFHQDFQWLGPDWTDINNPDTSAVGFKNGAALSPEAAAKLHEFIVALAGGLNLWVLSLIHISEPTRPY